jgi:hypothetical protein
MKNWKQGDILIPTAVFKELAIETNKPGVTILKTAISDGWLKVVNPEFSLKEKSLLQLLLDKGVQLLNKEAYL